MEEIFDQAAVNYLNCLFLSGKVGRQFVGPLNTIRKGRAIREEEIGNQNSARTRMAACIGGVTEKKGRQLLQMPQFDGAGILPGAVGGTKF